MGSPQARRNLLRTFEGPTRRVRGRRLALVFLALAAACAGHAAREADRAYTAGMARVERVEVDLASARPPRLRVAVEGTLPDACTRIDPPEIRLLGARISIALETRRPAGADCAPGELRFTRSIPVAVSGEFRLYVVEVNGVSDSVALPPDPDLLRFAPH